MTLGGKRFATETAPKPADYLDLVEKKGCGASVNDPLTEDAALTERLLMGLRTTEGTRLAPEEWAILEEKVGRLSLHGLVERQGERLVATASGRRILNSLLADLAP